MMHQTFHGALYMRCPNCGADDESGFITYQKLGMPHGVVWMQRCIACNRDYGTDREILAAVTGGAS
jgi:hypothetical protein